MRALTFLLFLALTISPVLAQVSSLSNAGASSVSGSSSGSNATGGSSNAASTANQGNAQNITFNSAPEPASRELKTVATVYAPSIGVSAPCLISASGGITGMGFGVAMGTNIEDPGCTLRETSRLLYSIGQPHAAARVMCANPSARDALGEEICPKPLAELPPPQACYVNEAMAKRAGLPVCVSSASAVPAK